MVRGRLAADCEAIYREALARTAARRLVADDLALEPLSPGPVRVLALGKAAGEMMAAALAALDDRARDPLCVVPEGVPGPPGARVLHGSHPRPAAGSAEAGRAILEWADAGKGAQALVLLSGGGSALAVAPPEGPGERDPVPFADKVEAVGLLMRAGLAIQELNAVRKHLSRLKGGRLGILLAPAPVRALVLSDVPGDDLSVIASGPLVADPSSWDDVRTIVASSGVEERLPPSVRARIEAGPAEGETPKPGDPRLDSIVHRILAGPTHLARVAAEAARELRYDAEADPVPLAGDVSEVATRLARWVRQNVGRGPRLLALGGEPTIRIPDAARSPDGGRAQHLALLCAQEIAGLPAAVLAAGSDGRDGPTEQAGAVVDGETETAAARAGLDLGAALAQARSGPAAVALGAAITSFPTGTHLCDLVLAAVE